MTGAEFRAWKDRLGLSKAGAAKALGCDPATIARHLRGKGLTRTVALACWAVEHGAVIPEPERN